MIYLELCSMWHVPVCHLLRLKDVWWWLEANRTNAACAFFSHFFKKAGYPSLLRGPITLEICRLWACARDMESLYVSARPSNGLDNKRLPPRNTHKPEKKILTRPGHFCHSRLRFLLLLCLRGLQMDKRMSFYKTRRQTINYIRCSCNKSSLCCQGIVHTLA